MTNSWMGDYMTVYRVLAEAGADFDVGENDSCVFRLNGSFFIGMGGLDVVVGPEVTYFINEEEHSLLEQLKTTDSGVMVGAF